MQCSIIDALLGPSAKLYFWLKFKPNLSLVLNTEVSNTLSLPSLVSSVVWPSWPTDLEGNLTFAIVQWRKQIPPLYLSTLQRRQVNTNSSSIVGSHLLTLQITAFALKHLVVFYSPTRSQWAIMKTNSDSIWHSCCTACQYSRLLDCSYSLRLERSPELYVITDISYTFLTCLRCRSNQYQLPQTKKETNSFLLRKTDGIR